MISLEILSQFAYEDLGYRPVRKVISYKFFGDWIEINFDTKELLNGEVVKADRFYKWLNDKREEKLTQIGI